MTSTRKPTVVLSLVKDNAASAKFISLEALSAEKKELVQRYQRVIAPGSVLVGAVTPSQSLWDVRPVILQRGQMTISRVFSPELLASISLTDALKRYVFHVEQLSPGLQGIVCGSNEGIAWVTRRYFTQLLSDGGVEIPLAERPALMHELLTYVEGLHKEGLIHGHIQPQNVAFDKGKLVLVDHGFQIFDPGSSHPLTLAPELRVTQTSILSADVASDVYGLGLVAKRLFGGELAVEYGNLVEVLLLNDPKLRPTLPQVAKHFSPSVKPTDVPLASDKLEIEKNSEKNNDTTGKSFSDTFESSLRATFSKVVDKQYSIILALGVVGILATAWHFITPSKQLSDEVVVNDDKFARLWDSNQLPLMQQVVQLVLKNNPSATAFLRKRLENGDTHQSIQQKFFVTAFHPLWADEISDDDFRALLIFGAPSLIPPSLRQAPDFSKLHPAVGFAIAATISPADGFSPLKVVTTKRLGTLPGMYGSAFLALDRLGITDMSIAAPQYLSHILSLDLSPSMIAGFLELNGAPKDSFVRLELLIPLLENITGLGDAIMNALPKDSDNPLAWFGKDVVAGWSQVGSADKIGLFSGVFPPSLAPEQLVDLLRFPLVRIREQALTHLVGIVGESYRQLLTYLSSDDCELTRTQSISLFSTVQVKGERARLFSLQWFDTRPTPKAVVDVLLRKPPGEKDEPFGIAAAKYLLNEGYKPTRDEIVALAKNSESLIRAYVYSQLALDKKEDKDLFDKLLSEEKDPQLLERQKKRLSNN